MSLLFLDVPTKFTDVFIYPLRVPQKQGIPDSHQHLRTGQRYVIITAVKKDAHMRNKYEIGRQLWADQQLWEDIREAKAFERKSRAVNGRWAPQKHAESGLRWDAWVPNSLEDLKVSSLSASLLDRAQRVDQKLAHLGYPYAPYLGDAGAVTGFEIWVEAAASSGIEGIHPQPNVIASAHLNRTAPAYKTGTELLDAVDVHQTDFVYPGRYSGVHPGDFQVESIQFAHSKILSTRPDWGGILRKEPVWIGGRNPAHAIYVPPPHSHVKRLMNDLTKWMREGWPSHRYQPNPRIGPTVMSAIAHGQFEKIHPFCDGNGRIGRWLIWAWHLRKGVCPPAISAKILANRQTYYQKLNSLTEGWNEWLEWYVEIAEQAISHTQRVRSVRIETQNWLTAQIPPQKKVAHTVLRFAVDLPVFSVQDMVSVIDSSTSAVREALRYLEHEAGLLKSYRSTRKVFWCDTVLNLVEFAKYGMAEMPINQHRVNADTLETWS